MDRRRERNTESVVSLHDLHVSEVRIEGGAVQGLVLGGVSSTE